MPIPDNFTFSLSDVKTEVDDGDANDISSLSEAFSVSNSVGFDDTYDDVSGANTQSLKEFRNYDHNASGGGGGGSQILMDFNYTTFAQGGATGFTTYAPLGTVETPNNSSTTSWTITWSVSWVYLRIDGSSDNFTNGGTLSGTGDAVQINARVENNGASNRVNRSVTFTITGGDTHTITQSGPAGDAAP
jgi:hypothetical protein